MSAKRIRSNYHKRVLEWLIDSGGSVSDIAQALDLRMPHASLALSQLRDSGDISRDDQTGIRGAIHRITAKGRERLEQDAMACLERHVGEIPRNRDAIILDSNGPMLLIGYVNKKPSTLLALPFDPLDYDSNGDLISIGNIGVRWATVRNIQPRWYDLKTLKPAPKQELQSTGTLEDWAEKKQFMVVVRAYLFDFEKQWNLAPGTWFSVPNNTGPLPNGLSSGNNLLGKVIDSDVLISPSQSIHAHLTSKLDSSLTINALSSDAIVVRDYPIKRENKTLPIGIIDFWVRRQHPRMKESKIQHLSESVKSFLSKDNRLNLPISMQRSLIRDFGNCRWLDEIDHNIEIKGFSEIGAASLIDYLLSVKNYELIVEWIWPINPYRVILEKLLSSGICRLLVTRSGDFTTLSNSALLLRSLPKIGEIELVISREQSLHIEINKKSGDILANNIHEYVPKDANELTKSFTNEGWNLGLMTDNSYNYQVREKLWAALEIYPKGDESWANRVEAEYPLASWIATPIENRPSRWIRIRQSLPSGWVDLLPLLETSTRDLLEALPKASSEWQNDALKHIQNRFEQNQESLLEFQDLLENPQLSGWFSVAILLCSDKLSKDFSPLIESCLEVWLDSPRMASKILSNLFPRISHNSNQRQNNLELCLRASKVHPKDSILFCWGELVDSLILNNPISLEQSRKFMDILPFNWWLNQGYTWLKMQLNSTSGRNWLSKKYLPWPAILSRAKGEKCGPPGHQEQFMLNDLQSNELSHILILGDGVGFDSLLDTYEMVFSNEQKQNLPLGRIHPLVGLLARDSDEWPDIDISVLESGDIDVGSLLFARHYNECLFNN
jgi:hypothetical protein